MTCLLCKHADLRFNTQHHTEMGHVTQHLGGGTWSWEDSRSLLASQSNQLVSSSLVGDPVSKIEKDGQ